MIRQARELSKAAWPPRQARDSRKRNGGDGDDGDGDDGDAGDGVDWRNTQRAQWSR